MASRELVQIVEKFADSGWDLIGAPSKEWLASQGSADRTVELLKAVEQAEKECGSSGCEFDTLYKRALKLLKSA